MRRAALTVLLAILLAPFAPLSAHAANPAQEDLAAFLVKPAEQALEKRNFPLAVSLWQGVVAIRGPADESVWQLATAWTLAGQFESAAEELERYRDAQTEPAAKAKAAKEITALRSRTAGFSGSVFKPQAATKEATLAFKLGRKAFSQKKYDAAIKLYEAGYAMAPDMPGNLRELGEAYEKLGRAKEANEFYTRYLRLRPFGKNSDRIRDRLKGAGEVGTLDIASSFPCEIVMMNRQVVPTKLPLVKLIVAPGTYKLLCYNSEFHLAHYQIAEIEKGEAVKIEFAWAILENKLDPWGRIVLEHPDPERKGQMYDVGVYDEIGIPVPEDRRALKIVMRSGDGTRTKETYVKIEPGKRIPLTW